MAEVVIFTTKEGVVHTYSKMPATFLVKKGLHPEKALVRIHGYDMCLVGSKSATAVAQERRKRETANKGSNS